MDTNQKIRLFITNNDKPDISAKTSQKKYYKSLDKPDLIVFKNIY